MDQYLPALPVRADRSPVTEPESPELNPQLEDAQLLGQLALWYRNSLARHESARQFLTGRGLAQTQLLEHFQLGFAARQLMRQLPPTQNRTGAALRKRLTRLGICRASGHGHFNGCLIVPIHAVDGQIQDLVGYKISRGQQRRPHVFRVGHAGPAGVLNAHGLQPEAPLVLTDGPLAALAVWAAGVSQVSCSSPGQDQVDPALLQLCRQLRIQQVVLAMRNTKAGNAAAEALRAQLAHAGLTVQLATLTAGSDAADVLTRHGADRLVMLLSQALERPLIPAPRGAPPERTQPERAAPENTQPESPPPQDAQPESAADDDPLATIHLVWDDRHWRVRGLSENLSPQRLRVNLKVQRDGLFSINTIDLYAATQRNSFVREAAEDLYVSPDLVKRDLGRLLSELEARQQALLERTLTPAEPQPVQVTGPGRAAALRLLRDEQLVGRITEHLEAGGLVGEESNKLLLYLACVSRLLDRPLSVLVQSSSAAGKSSLVEAVLRLMPDEAQVRYSAMTGQSLYYMGQQNLQHKILAISEEEGVAQASYALKLLQSEGSLRIAVAGKDEATGRQQTQEYAVEGPVMMVLTTTNPNPDAELQNRCLTLQVNESPEQTGRILARQRAGYLLDSSGDDDALATLHADAQRLLRPYRVVIPWAEQLTFRGDQLLMRREQPKYLALIASLTLLHQYQRRRVRDGAGRECLVATLDDVRWAHTLACGVLGRTLEELLPQTRQLLEAIYQYARQRCQAEQRPIGQLRFTQRQLRTACTWSDFALRKHLRRLMELEYVISWRSGQGNQRLYQLLYDGQGQAGEPFVLGLVDVDQLQPVQCDAGPIAPPPVE